MSLDLVFLILVLLVILYIIIIEIFTVIFMITGMSNTRAKFQVISLLTNCGFTTTESETVVSSRKRRKVAISIMLFGTIFNVAVVSLLVNAVLSFSRDNDFNVLHATLYLLSFLAFITIIKKVPFFRVTFDNIVKRIATKVIYSKNANPMLILDNFHGFVIVQLKIIDVPVRLDNKSLVESRISKDYGIRILTIRRDDRTIGDVSKDEIIRKNDRLMIYGPLSHIIDVFEQRPSHYSKAT